MRVKSQLNTYQIVCKFLPQNAKPLNLTRVEAIGSAIDGIICFINLHAYLNVNIFLLIRISSYAWKSRYLYKYRFFRQFRYAVFVWTPTTFTRGFLLIKKKNRHILSTVVVDRPKCTRQTYVNFRVFIGARTSVNTVIVPAGTSLVRSDNRIEKINKNYERYGRERREPWSRTNVRDFVSILGRGTADVRFFANVAL